MTGEKIIVIAILFITIASVVFGFKVFQGKILRKKSLLRSII